jgi:hypothetical protein
VRPVGAGCSAHHLAADLLAIFGIDRSSLLTSDGSLDSYSVATDHDLMVYQHARHLGLSFRSARPGGTAAAV